MTLGVVLTITNPISSGYLSYLAAISTWIKIADKVLILDGGSVDGSIEKISLRFGNYSNVEIIQNQIVYWGKDDNFDVSQLAVTLNYGLSLLNTDWAFAFSTDYIPYNWERKDLENQFENHKNSYWVKTFVGKPINGKIIHKLNERNILFNLKKIREDKLKIGYGIDNRTNIGSDFPIIFEGKSFFIDPVINVKKYIYRGRAIKTDSIFDLECIAYGHFFYNQEQLEYKIRRWDRAFSRFLGIVPARLKQLLIWHNVPRGKKYYSKEEVLGWDHPEEIKEVIEKYYGEGMIGGIIDERTALNKKLDKVILFLLKIERKIRTFYLKLFKGLKAEKDELKWEKFE